MTLCHLSHAWTFYFPSTFCSTDLIKTVHSLYDYRFKDKSNLVNSTQSVSQHHHHHHLDAHPLPTIFTLIKKWRLSMVMQFHSNGENSFSREGSCWKVLLPKTPLVGHSLNKTWLNPNLDPELFCACRGERSRALGNPGGRLSLIGFSKKQ